MVCGGVEASGDACPTGVSGWDGSVVAAAEIEGTLGTGFGTGRFISHSAAVNARSTAPKVNGRFFTNTPARCALGQEAKVRGREPANVWEDSR